MFEHAIYSVISPEAASSILWRDGTKAQEAANSYDNEGRTEGIRQFIADQSYKPGLGAYALQEGR